MAPLIMTRTTCCESYKVCGSRCEICPDRPENREAAARYQQELSRSSLGRRVQLVNLSEAALSTANT